MRIFRIIPFSWLPASWGLSGRLREEQEARYYFDGHELEIKLAQINYTGEAFLHRKLEIDHQHGLIDQETYDKEKRELIADPIEREIAIVEHQVETCAITAIEGDKRIATIRREPWIRVINDGLDEDQGPNSYYFEFDWNDLWIEQLQNAGYSGHTEEEIVQTWFSDVLYRSRT